MSQEIDLSTPLTAEEFTYLVQRSRGDLIERAHSMHGTSDADYAAQLSGDGTGPQPQPVLQGEARAARRQALLDELAMYEEEDGEGASADEDEEPLEPYDQWNVSRLDQELKARELPVTGSKAEKIARLEADDEASA